MTFSGGRKRRRDIQALRGVAVLLVLLDHLGWTGLPAGFLGVDIFFVISGYLITRLIADARTQGTFKLTDFWAARARRLLPAAQVVMLFTMAGAWLVMSKDAVEDLFKVLLGALTFTANIVLSRETGYFSGTANLVPLLHMWSLSVEEQYYLLIAPAMLLCPRRLRLLAAILLTAASLYIVFHASPRITPTAAYYVLPTRAWQLGLGGVAALSGLDGKLHRLWLPALAVILLISAYPIDPVDRQLAIFPGYSAMLVCIAAATIMLGGSESIEKCRWLLPLAAIGEISYALYLVHWPLISLAHNAFADDEVGWIMMTALGLASIGLAFLLHRYVEMPIHHARWLRPGTVLLASLASTAILAGFGWMVAVTARPAAPTFDREFGDFAGFGKQCNQFGAYLARPDCQNGSTPTMMLWGDSFAMHLVPGIAATSPRTIAQATRARCGPLNDIATMSGIFGPLTARGCIQFNHMVLDHVARDKTIEVVVLAADFEQYTNPTLFRQMVKNGDRYIDRKVDHATAAKALVASIRLLRKMGRKVVLIAPPPSDSFDIGLCLNHLSAGTVLLLHRPQCQIDARISRARRSEVAALLDQVSRQADAAVIDLAPELCDADYCRTTLNGIPLYLDHHHLSRAGSIELARQFGLARRIEAAAR